MNIMVKKILGIVRWPLLTVSIYILFHNWIEALLTNFLVCPVLSKINFIGGLAPKLAYAIILFIATYWALDQLKKEFRFSTSWIIWSFFATIFYSYYRFTEMVWTFAPLFENWDLKAADVMYLILIFFLVARLVNRLKQNGISIDNKTGFLRDDPTVINQSDDKHERHRFIGQIKDRILSTTRGTNSFCIGVIAPWGVGKTTFLNSLMIELRASEKIIDIEFSPWIKAGASSLTEAFFAEFAYHLRQHTDLLQKDIENYVKLLANKDRTSLLGKILQYLFPSLGWHMSSIEETKDRISLALSELNKKVVIIIDDVDRLDQKEIQEVFRLVRNSAGFPDVFYVIAFDKIQVEKSLENSFELGFDKFLEKILQVEFYLPPIHKNILINELINELSQRVNASNKEILKKVFSESDDSSLASLNWIGNFFNHHRDIVRFLNQFDLHYTFVNGQVFLPDFIALMVLRLKYPEFYYYLYKNRFEILSYKEKNASLYDEGGEMILTGIDEKSSSYDKTKLKELLEKGIPEAGVKSGDFGPLQILKNVFESPHIPVALPNWPILRSGYKSHLSVKYSQYFTRYFDFSFSGRLSDVEFEDALNDNKNVFMKKIQEWCLTKTIGKEVVNSLERITEIVDKERFDKIITGLIFISTNTFNGNNYSINNRLFLDRFRFNSRENKKRLLSIFGTETECSQYLLKILTEHCVAENWSYSLAKAIINAEDEKIFSELKHQIASLIVSACKNYFSSNPRVNYKFRSIYMDWEKYSKMIYDLSPNQNIKNYILKNFREGIKLFVGPCQMHFDEGSYKFYDDWIKVFFTERNEFIKEAHKIDPEAGKELSDLNELISNNSDMRDCVPFDFKVLQVEKAIE